MIIYRRTNIFGLIWDKIQIALFIVADGFSIRTIGYLMMIFLLAGCATGASFHRVVCLPATEIHVFNSDFPTGWATPGVIMVSGHLEGGEIVPDHDVLAHEIRHLMRFQSREFKDPDKR